MRFFLPALLIAALPIGPARAQSQTGGPHDASQTAGDVPAPGQGVLHLSAVLPGSSTPLPSGLHWTIIADAPDTGANHGIAAQSNEAQPALTLPDGDYVVHLGYGFASQMKRVKVADKVASERLTVNAGALAIEGRLGDEIIGPDKLNISIYVPEHGNPQAKLVTANVRPGQVVRLPEGMYHIVSTYLDTVGVGSLAPVSNTNSVVNADLRVQAGKLLDATVKHRAAVETLKLVNAPGGEALADTSFTILTPGGDVVRELIGAFPSLVLAEGDYIAIARHGGRTYQSEFKVESGVDRDVEVPTQQGG